MQFEVWQSRVKCKLESEDRLVHLIVFFTKDVYYYEYIRLDKGDSRRVESLTRVGLKAKNNCYIRYLTIP